MQPTDMKHGDNEKVYSRTELLHNEITSWYHVLCTNLCTRVQKACDGLCQRHRPYLTWISFLPAGLCSLSAIQHYYSTLARTAFCNAAERIRACVSWKRTSHGQPLQTETFSFLRPVYTIQTKMLLCFCRLTKNWVTSRLCYCAKPGAKSQLIFGKSVGYW